MTPGPSIYSVFSVGTETTSEDCREGRRRQTILYHSWEFPGSEHGGQFLLLVGISSGSRVGHKYDYKERESHLPFTCLSYLCRETCFLSLF